MNSFGAKLKSYNDLDGYVRQRLRVNFANRGKRHAHWKDGKMLTVKYGNSFFARVMGLVSGQYMTMQIRNPDVTVDYYLLSIKKKGRMRRDAKTKAFFEYAYAR